MLVIRRRLVAFVVGTSLLAAGCATTGTRAGGFLSGESAPLPPPSERLTPLGLDELRGVIAGQRGRPIVLNLWASWCGPCEAEAPLLRRASENAGDKVVFIGVDVRDARRAAAEFLDRHGIKFLNVADPAGATEVATRTRGLPTTLLIDRRGRVTATVTGALSEQQLAAHLRALTS